MSPAAIVSGVVCSGAMKTFALIAFSIAAAMAALAQNPSLGIMLPGLAGSPEKRVQVARELGATWYRPGAIQLRGDAKCDDCEAARKAGLKLGLVVRNSDSAGKASTPVTGLEDFKKRIRAVVEQEKPGLLVVEDEPENPKNFSGDDTQFLAELQTACEVAHEMKILCANGGFSSLDTANLVIADKMGRDEVSGAKFAVSTEVVRYSRPGSFNVNVFSKSVGKGSSGDDEGVKATKEYLAKHKTEIDRAKAFFQAVIKSGADRLNFHWYEVQPDNVTRVTDALYEMTDQKMKLMSDELADREPRAFAVSEKIKLALDARVAPVIWVGTDERNGSVGLVDKKGELRPAAQAFRSEAAKQ